MWLEVGVSRKLLSVSHTDSCSEVVSALQKNFERSFCDGRWLCATIDKEPDVINHLEGKNIIG